MNKIIKRLALLFFISFSLIFSLIFSLKLFNNTAAAAAKMPKGIYVTQPSMENTDFVNYLIQRSKAAGISVFVVDLERPSKRYQNNIALLKQNNISYVARIVVFSNGGTPANVTSEKHWEKKYQLVQNAVAYGADQIQLDYIRYNTAQRGSAKNAQDIHKVIRWYKDRLLKQSVPLQIDVFGISSFGEESHIGHNIKMFSQTVDVICPMVYPSHYEPFRQHAVTPYQTVFDSLVAVKGQFADNKPPFKLVPYIELSNYRYPLSRTKKLAYIHAQIKAVEDAGADGWYAWSPHNKYETLFEVLKTYPTK